MTRAITSVHLDTETVTSDDSAILNMFQVLAINLACSLVLTLSAMLFGVSWWVAVLLGWLGASVATLPIAALVVLLWPVTSQTEANRRPPVAVTASDTQSHLRMWQRDLEEELDAAFVAAAMRDGRTPAGWSADIERHADMLAGQIAAEPVRRTAV